MKLGNISAVHLNNKVGTKPMSVGTFFSNRRFGLSNVNKFFLIFLLQIINSI